MCLNNGFGHILGTDTKKAPSGTHVIIANAANGVQSLPCSPVFTTSARNRGVWHNYGHNGFGLSAPHHPRTSPAGPGSGDGCGGATANSYPANTNVVPSAKITDTMITLTKPIDRKGPNAAGTR
jgi:hypothetical protein